MAPSTPERNRLVASTVLTTSPVSSIQSRTALSPINKRTTQLLFGSKPSSSSSLSKGVSGSVAATTALAGGSTTVAGGAGGQSQLSKEAARYAKQLKALTGGWPSTSSAASSTLRGGGRGGARGFLNSGSSASSRFAASATAGALSQGGLGAGGIPSLSPSSVLRDSNKDNISNNNTASSSSSSSTPSVPTTPHNGSAKSLFLASLTASTPKSVLGKRSSSAVGLMHPITPGTISTTTLSASSPLVSLHLGAKTPTPNAPSASATASSTGDKTTSISAMATAGSSAPSSPQRRKSYGRVASIGGGGGGVSGGGVNAGIKSMAAQAASSLTRTISSGGLTAKLEVVTNDWLGGGSSPKRGRKVYNQGDRFIPNRSATNMSSAQAKLDLVRHPSFSGSTADATDEASIAYSQHIAEACGINLDSRMLAFSAEPPSLDGTSRDSSSAVRKIYSRHPSFTRSTSNLLLKKRTILTSPEKVLDAPGLMDDYYLNLLDWSCSNMVAIGLDKSVFVWDAESGHAESLVTLPGNTDAIASVSWAYDGLSLAIGTFDGDTQIWDIETKTKVRSMTGHVARVGVLAWDKHILSSGCRDGSIWNHDVRVQNHKVAELRNHTNEVCGLVWRADGQQLASGGNDNLVNIWDARSTVPKHTKSNHTAAVKALAWCPWQNNLLASGGGTYDKQIHFWNATTGARVNTLNTGSQVTSIVWSSEYKEFMSSHGYPDNNISVYGYPSMNRVIDIPAHDSRILHTALSPDGQTVATVASDENLKFWKLFEKRPSNKKDGKGTRTATSSFTRSGSFGGGRLGDEDGDEDDRRGPGGASGGGSGTTVKGKSISSMTRIR